MRFFARVSRAATVAAGRAIPTAICFPVMPMTAESMSSGRTPGSMSG